MRLLFRITSVLMMLLLFSISSFAQKAYPRYNVDSLLKKLSVHPQIKASLAKAAAIYKHACISGQDVSLNAFKVAYLEKNLADLRLIQLTLPNDSMGWLYANTQVLTVVDYTKKGNRKRLVTVDLVKQKIIKNTLVSHGSAMGQGVDELVHTFGISKARINNRNEVPAFFGNAEDSYRSSLGLVLTIEGPGPDNLCHLCKYFISKPHKCVVLLAGYEEGINDHDVIREIVVHTTGSKDFSDSASITLIGTRIELDTVNIKGLKKKDCNCLGGTNPSSSYASACGIAENKGYIGRSAGCFVLPEEDHIAVMEAIRGGSLLFAYSDSMAPGSTHYFEDSPIIKAIIALAK